MTWFSSQVRLLRQQGLANRLKAFMKKILRRPARRGMAILRARPGLHYRLAALANRVGMAKRLRSLIFELEYPHPPPIISATGADPEQSAPPSSQHLSAHAKRIFAQLLAELSKQQKS
mgnify:FL=1